MLSRSTRLFATATAVATFLLLLVGGLVNPTGSSLACPDWPLCHGSAFPQMVGGVFFEHSHRLVATGVGLMTVILGVLLWRDGRRGLALGAVAMVVLQGVLGGLTVIFKLPPEISLSHLALSMTFFAFLIYLATGAGERPRPLELSPLRARLVVVAAISIWVQIILGGLVRHTKSALACATEIPLCLGQLWPAGSLNAEIHMTHRLVGVIAGLLAIAAAVVVARRARWALVIPVLVVVQITLGIYTVTTLKLLPVVEAHLGVGAALLALCTVLALRVRAVPTPASVGAPLVAERAR